MGWRYDIFLRLVWNCKPYQSEKVGLTNENAGPKKWIYKFIDWCIQISGKAISYMIREANVVEWKQSFEIVQLQKVQSL